MPVNVVTKAGKLLLPSESSGQAQGGERAVQSLFEMEYEALRLSSELG